MKKDSPELRTPPHPSRSLGSATAAAAAAVEIVGFPFRSSTSAVPFSWEQRPGIPKPSGNLVPPSYPLLPLPPPPLRPAPLPPRRRRSTTSSAADPDPFAAALAECAKEPPPRDMEEIWWSAAAAAAAERRRAAASAAAAAERLGFMGGMYGSCKAGCSVVESTVHVPRSGIRTGGYALVNRR